MLVLNHRDVLALAQGGSAQIVDVLPLHEYRSAHIRGAIHLPLPRLWQEATTALSPALPVVVYCRDSL
ncbi:MAG TPA: rhodanese-like domain-containing protein [Candidatus Binataceae bacterium]|jgi:rhodanese-related sulfurtransferase|nr:rhodanese-like domain-containing protein [Candidatus Binataceae bacterium]